MFTSDRFREVLGHFPTGVVVITSIAPDGTPTGMAVGSFTSVSLDPPLVAFLPDKKSTTFPKIRSAGHFCVNVLGADQEEVCRAFALKGSDKFKNRPWRPAASGAPILDRVVAWINCDIETIHEAGDHYIVIGRVRELDVASARPPLLFFQGGYGRFSSRSLTAPAEADLMEHIRLADRVRSEMESLATDLGLECFAVAAVGDEIVKISSAGTPSSGETPRRVGLRLPFMPPWSPQFLAWAEAAEVRAWFDRQGGDIDAAARRAYQRDLELVRRYRWTMTLRCEHTDELDAVLDTMAAHGSTPLMERRLRRAMAGIAAHIDPGEIREDRYYDIRSLNAPIFGSEGEVALLLGLSGLPSPVSGKRVLTLRDRLLSAADAATAALGGRPPGSEPARAAV